VRWRDMPEVVFPTVPVTMNAYHWCPHNLNPNFVDEIQELCRSLVWHFYQTEDYSGHFDVIHAHDWLVSNAMVWFSGIVGVSFKWGGGLVCASTCWSRRFGNRKFDRPRLGDRLQTAHSIRSARVRSEATRCFFAWATHPHRLSHGAIALGTARIGAKDDEDAAILQHANRRQH